MSEIIIFIANSWGISNGGINSFNYDLTRHLAMIRKGTKNRVACVVLDSSVTSVIRNEVSNDYGLMLLSVSKKEDEKYQSEDRLPKCLCNLRELIGIRKDEKIIWVGHDIKTGNYANLCRDKYGGKSVVICHMDYDSYHFLAVQDPVAAKEKRDLQKKIFRSADAVGAVGPLLVTHAEDICGDYNTPVFEVDPGLLDHVKPRKRKLNTFRAVFTGRLEKKNNYIKQPTLAIAAFVRAVIENPDVFYKSGTEPTLDIIGYDNVGVGNKVKELSDVVKSYAGDKTVNVRANEYIDSRDKLVEEIRESSLCIMLSRHEGFGLSAYEAISAGVPIIISEQSGLYIFLKGLPQISGNDNELFSHVNVQGRLKDGSDLPSDEDLENAKQVIIEVAKHIEDYRRKAVELKEILEKQGYTWEGQAQAFLSNVHHHCYFQNQPELGVENERMDVWEHEESITTTEFLGKFFLPNMCGYLLDLKPDENCLDYVKSVIARFDAEHKIRRNIAELGQSELEVQKTRQLDEGVVGIMRQINLAEIQKCTTGDGTEGCPVFYDFRTPICYFLNIDEEISGLTRYNDSAGEQDDNLRAILAIPIIWNSKLEGAATIEFFNLSKLPEMKNKAQIKELLLRAKRQMKFLNICLFSDIE